MTSSYLPIRYREFYDIPRVFIVDWNGAIYLFESPFDNDRDEYQPNYSAYRLGEDLRERFDDVSWTDLAILGEPLGSVDTGLVEFDPTRRELVNASVFEHLGL